MKIKKKYWTVFKPEDLGDLYQEYAHATDMGPIMNSNGTISYRTTGCAGSLFHEGDFSCPGNHRTRKARKSTTAGKTFYCVRLTTHSGLWYIDTNMFSHWSDDDTLDDTVIAKYKIVSNEIDTTKIKDFIYKVDDSNSLTIQTNYDSIDSFFNDTSDKSYDNNETICILAIDTKIPIVKLEKTKLNGENEFKFIVDIRNNTGDEFKIKTVFNTPEKFYDLLESTIDSLRNYFEFYKYAEELDKCL